ncbi:hypothetical protein B0T20DRAFT_466427 [Sordaria brevicollis]|uniref:Aldolase n=1 Tax=Sordaria brevicollis TaxID=83679 RepID=A0AAE0UFC3_SORBR|nr:hypothetical protein B0T20DRAFT_466427 [Sordaria brevicollis]
MVLYHHRGTRRRASATIEAGEAAIVPERSPFLYTWKVFPWLLLTFLLSPSGTKMPAGSNRNLGVVYTEQHPLTSIIRQYNHRKLPSSNLLPTSTSQQLHDQNNDQLPHPHPHPHPPKGVWVPSPTFFTRSSYSSYSSTQPAIDTTAQIAHTIFLARSGITGVVLLGSTGEAMHLSRSERSQLIKSVRSGLDEAGFKSFPIMAGVLTNGGVEETVQWLDDYSEAGAEYGLVLVPGYFGPGGTSQRGVVGWFEEVLGGMKSGKMGVVVYNYPGVTNGTMLEPEGYRVLAQNPRVVGCKMSHGNISHHLQVSLDPQINHDRFRVFSGFGQQLGPIVLFGAAGVIDGMSAFYPKTVVRLFELAQKDDLRPSEKAEMKKLQYVVSKAEEFVVKYGLKGIKEATYRVAGFGDLDAMRVPVTGRMSEEEWEEGRRRWLGEIEDVEKGL